MRYPLRHRARCSDPLRASDIKAERRRVGAAAGASRPAFCPGQVGELVSPRTSVDGTCAGRSEGHLNASLRGRHRPPPSVSLTARREKSLCELSVSHPGGGLQRAVP
ncbi:unnamed protein product [Rangifer tarandus platyrhynchus]|uniref:Uncharacterized protein n=2 Tax=Rangifer tarandus platyrhynchus TaxID=3082113 RepID=A0ABN8XWF3_RANTA|nr:unnamed protein product [Rangifer tarandus platyrhynchus]